MVIELINEMLKEGKRQFNDNLRLNDPITHLENQVKLMYAHQEISAQQYYELLRKVHQHRIGRGDLEILHRQAAQQANEKGGEATDHLSPAIKQRLDQLAMDRVRLEDIQHEAQEEMDSLQANVMDLQQQARQASQKAQEHLSDEQAVRDYLELEQDLLDRVHKINERTNSLRQGLTRLETLKKHLESYEAELKSVDIEERLTGAALSVREETLKD